MPSTETQRHLFRLEFGGDATSFPDAYIDFLYDQAVATYGEDKPNIVTASVYYAAARHLRVKASQDVDWQANTVSEKLSQRFANLDKLVAEYKATLDELIDEDAPASLAVGWAKLHEEPPTVRRYPETDWDWGSYVP